MLIGSVSAIFAAFVWSLNFIVPFVIGKYSVFDFALFRFIISGLVGLGYLSVKGYVIRPETFRDFRAACGLAFIGYVGYFLAVTGAALYAGPVIAPAFLGLVPVMLGIVGNVRHRSIAWRWLSMPLALILGGLLSVNHRGFDVGNMAINGSIAIGTSLALTAVALWTWFALLNQSALARRPTMDSGVWTALILVGGGLEMLAFLPIGLALGVFEIPKLGLAWNSAAPLYIWGSSLALLASTAGAWAWTLAARKLPVALSAQLIVLETAFGTVFGLWAHRCWPSLADAIGITLLIVGVMLAIHLFHRHRQVAKLA